jgi:predicted RNA-binding Zn-ribbon protein involved in translation (DUF1610 family)
MAQAFDCPSCGAHLNPRDLAASSRCPYCNKPLILSQELSGSPAVLENCRLSPRTLDEIIGHIHAHQNAQAIKKLRDATGLGFEEAKEAVEGAERSIRSGGEAHREPEAILAQVVISAPPPAQEPSHFPRPPLGMVILILIILLAILIPILLFVWK